VSTKKLGEMVAYVDERIKLLEEKENNFTKVLKRAQDSADAFSNKIALDVGGTKFTTSKSTLLSAKGSFFEAMLSSGHWKPEADGSFFIDRDPKFFPIILNFLRMGKVLPNIDPNSIDELEAELDFYQIKFPDLKQSNPTLLLSEHYKQLIVQWIGNPSNLNLLYSATGDGGFSAKEFHDKCDNKGPTVVVVKSTEGYVFGGYAAHSWDSSGKYIGRSSYINSQSSFLFTLTNQHKVPPTKYSVTHEGAANAMRCLANCGPIFGGGYDLFIGDSLNGHNSSYSEFPFSYGEVKDVGFYFAGTRDFQISQVDVYSVDM